MAGRLERRVRNLEAGDSSASGKDCPECGFDGDWSKAKYEVVWNDDPEEASPGKPRLGPHETVYCETCGEPTETVVWDDLLLDHERRELD